MSIVEEKGIYFVNNKVEGAIYKYAVSNIVDIDIGFLNFHKDTDILLEIISDVTKSIEGHFDDISDPDISNNIDIAFIAEDSIEYYDRDGQTIVARSPLIEFKEKAIAWRNFLLTPPFHGSSA